MKISWVISPVASVVHSCVRTSGSSKDNGPKNSGRAEDLVAVKQLLDQLRLDLPSHDWGLVTFAAWLELQDEFPLPTDAEILKSLLGDLSALRARSEKARASLSDELPDLTERLRLRSRPLQMLWEARGPGLLTQAGRILRSDPLPPQRLTVVAVEPVLGGGGGVNGFLQCIGLEAVLTNADASLPEVARLGWLALGLSIIHLLAPLKGPELHIPEHLVELLALPIALEAAAHVELVRPRSGLLVEAGKTWLADASPAKLEATASWWERFSAHGGFSETPFETAVDELTGVLERL